MSRADSSAATVVMVEVAYWLAMIPTNAHNTAPEYASWPCAGPPLPATMIAEAMRVPKASSAVPSTAPARLSPPIIPELAASAVRLTALAAVIYPKNKI